MSPSMQIGMKIWRNFTKAEQKAIKKDLEGLDAKGLASRQQLIEWVQKTSDAALGELLEYQSEYRKGGGMEKLSRILTLLFICTISMLGCRNPTQPTFEVPSVPIAEFTVSPVLGVAPLSVVCLNLTEPADAVMNWQFGDGAISNDTHPSHTFQNPGVYDIVLIAYNTAGSSEMIYTSIVVTGQPVPPSGPFPPGPEVMQHFMLSGNTQIVQYQEGSVTEFDVSIFAEEDGIPGTPSQIGGWGISAQWSLEDDFAVPVEVVWSDYIMSLNGGDGPDMMIGGLYADYNEINMGCIANVSYPIDWWYLPPSEPVEIVRMTWTTVPNVLGNQTATIDFHIGDSLATPNSNVVGVNMPDGTAQSAHIGNGHLTANDWQITLQPQP